MDDSKEYHWEVEEIVQKRGDKWVLLSKEGDVLGTHDSKAAAEKQEQAINISKHKDDEDTKN